MQLYHYFVNQSSEFCYHNPLCCLLTSVYYCCCCCLFRYRLSPETCRYTLVWVVGWGRGSQCSADAVALAWPQLRNCKCLVLIRHRITSAGRSASLSSPHPWSLLSLSWRPFTFRLVYAVPKIFWNHGNLPGLSSDWISPVIQIYPCQRASRHAWFQSPRESAHIWGAVRIHLPSGPVPSKWSPPFKSSD
jgi:hypothetical protein